MKDDVNKRLCELLGVEWPNPRRIWDAGKFYYYCTDNTRQNDDPSGGQKDCSPCTKPCCPDFFSPAGRIDLLRRMKGRIDWPEFYMETLQYYHEKAGAIAVTPWKRFILNHARDEGVSFPVDLMLDDTGALAKACLEFLEKEREK
jgi:hypothetical protein